MSLRQRLERLEQAESDRRLYREAERLAERSGRGVDQVLRQLREIGARIERWGWDAETRRLAREFQLNEEEMRARLDAHIADYRRQE